MIDLNAANNALFHYADNIRSLTFRDPDGSRRDVEVQIIAVPNGIASGDPRYREVMYTSTIRLRNRV